MYRIDERLKQVFIEGSKLDGLYSALYKEISKYGFSLTDKNSKWTTIDTGNKPLRDCLCSIINKVHNKSLDPDDYNLHHKNAKHDFNDYRNLVLYPRGKLLKQLQNDIYKAQSHKKLHNNAVLNAFDVCLGKKPINGISDINGINYKKNKILINKYIIDNIKDIFNFYIEDLQTFPYENFGGIDIEKYF